MEFKLPILPHKFKLALPSGNNPSPEQLNILNQIESKIDHETMEIVLDRIHKFYVEGQKHWNQAVPALIKLGGITQEQVDWMKQNSPSTEDSSDIIDYFEPSFIIMVPEPENCGEGTFGLTMECKWDPEHGVGVWFENWRPKEAGFAETAYR